MKKTKVVQARISPDIILSTPSGKILIDIKSVGTASVSIMPIESVIKEFEKASKKKLFTAPEELNGEYSTR